MMDLSPRLKGILSMITETSALADVGCDHGYISYGALSASLVERVAATDISPGSLEKAKLLLESTFPKERFDTVLTDGLSGFSPGDFTAAVIAGMGGETMIHILSSSLPVFRAMDYVILQSMQGHEELFDYLNSARFTVIDVKLIREKHRFYPILKVKLGGVPSVFSWTLFTGEAEFPKLVAFKIGKIDEILKKIEDNDKQGEVRKSLLTERERWEGYL